MNKTINSVIPTLILIAFAALSPSLGLAAAGNLDTTFGRFGTNGIVSLGDMSTRQMALLPDGKILVIGSNGPNLVIRRLQNNGDSDSTFGTNGKVSIDLGDYDACGLWYSRPFGCGIAVQQDGRFVVVGDYSAGGNTDFAVLRFLANGDLDPSFGIGGLVTVDFDSRTDYAHDVGIQADGKIVIVGMASFEGNNDERMGVARLNTNGSLDTSFSDDGKQNVSFGVSVFNHREHSANALAIQSDGKIVVAGKSVDYGTVTQNDDFGIARLNQDGSFDNSFSGDGRKRIGFGDNETAYDVEIASDGKIVVVGGASIECCATIGKQFAVARLSSDGELDNSFSDDGRLLLNQVADVEETLIAVDLQADGKIVATGHADTKIQMIRLSPEGLFDSSFSSDGIFTPKSGDIQANYIEGYARDLIIQPNGNYLLLYGDAIMGFNPDLTRVSGSADIYIDLWSTKGTVVTDFGNGAERAFGLTMQRDGKPIVIGDTKSPNAANTRMAIARYLPSGALDTTFAWGGMQRVGDIGDNFGRSATVLANGKILVAGYSRTGPTADLSCALFRLNADGRRDFVFSLLGIHTSIGDGDDICVKVLVQDDDKIILVGYSATFTNEHPNRYGISLVRYDQNGNLDTSFNGTGKVITNIGNGVVTRSRNAILQSDGKILVSGTHDGDMLVMRYNTNGTLDSSFGTGGIVLADHGGVVESRATGEHQAATDGANGAAFIDIGYGLGFIYQGHIAVGGLVDGVDFGILVLTPDGARCTVCGLFNGDFYFRLVDFGYTEAAYGFAVQDNGSMVLTGGESSGDSGVHGARFKRKRVIEQGGYEIDTAFGGDGKVSYGSKFRSSARANALYGLGIFVAGYRFNGNDDDFFLMKLENDSETWPGGVKFEDLIFADGFENE